MASNDNSDTSNTSKGGKNNNASRNRSAAAAAEEDDDTTAAAEREPPPYDPRQFQNPHPDDRDGGKTCGKTKTTASKDTSGKAAADGSHCCYHCGTAGAKSCCGGCHRAWYCGRACQKAGWRGHKTTCRAAQRAEARRAAWRAAASLSMSPLPRSRSSGWGGW